MKIQGVINVGVSSHSLCLAMKTPPGHNDITTGTVERLETFEHTINATGEILPEFEDIITSPINASIHSVKIDVGSPVKAGVYSYPR